MAGVEQDIHVQEKGLAVRKQYVADAARDIAAKRKELVQQEAKLAQLELKVAELEKVKQAEEDKYNAAREAAEKIIQAQEQKTYVIDLHFSF